MNLVLNFKGFTKNLEKVEPLLNGVQYVFKFDNGYRASVIKTAMSYGHEDDLWELAVLSEDSSGNLYVDYDTDIGDDVFGWRTDEEVRDLLSKIKELKISK